MGPLIPPDHEFDNPEDGFCTLFIAGMNSQSRGDIRLISSNPKDPPLINPNYFADPYDLINLKEGIRVGMSLMKTPTMKDRYIQPILAPNSESDKDLVVCDVISDDRKVLIENFRTISRIPHLGYGIRAVVYKWGRAKRMGVVWTRI